ncbi:MAG: diaminopimelate decarboxylase [Bacteroidaceae bacterium]|nr:diaminopimelate decarboxylase [Bacteroidaceae bacterium]
MTIYDLKEQFQQLETPFYYYDTELLDRTLEAAKQHAAILPQAHLHFAVKANANPVVLRHIKEAGLGADCVSGGEIERCLEVGIPANKIVYAGVGKTDREIRLGIENDILCFNVESLPELKIINSLAAEMGKIARVALRINPNIDAHTHKNITTGLEENKFGISLDTMEAAIKLVNSLNHLELYGLHFHIGSQILHFSCFEKLCKKINQIQTNLERKGYPQLKSINVGGGLGVDYVHPFKNPMADFKKYFAAFAYHLKLRPGQSLHFELGRSLSAQWGYLITRTILVKKTEVKKFVIVDAGFTDLIRPALYQAHHQIVNLNGGARRITYDVVGPICESSDVFDTNIKLSPTHRGDLLAILSAGAYGYVMASGYNCRKLPKEYTSEDFK